MTEEFRASEKQILDAKQAFCNVDKKKEGTVSCKDLGAIFKSLGLLVKDDKIKDWSDEMDEEATGRLNCDAWIQLFERKLKEDLDERELKEAFRVLDKEKKGVIKVDVLRWILSSLGDELTEEEIENMIAETDTDGSGTVDYEEFKTLMIGA
ncbi:troponin C isoform X2 [Mizuhopecten yessoensis]|uniref:troponin C isoform X2 n=1 Tax=Mizuhopecten yessoensis TaxID=6573 RepID=UPI000B458917|nr:troponin C isoform X2 [Mizuhopecten yessoensis]